MTFKLSTDHALRSERLAFASVEAAPGNAHEEAAAKSQPRTRLEVDARRAQLLELGRELFTTRSLRRSEHRARSRARRNLEGLLYHYFPSKRVFYVESVREAAGELLRHTHAARNLSPIERLRAGIDAYLAYVDRHRSVFAALIWRGILHDPEVNRIVETTRTQFFDRLFTEIVTVSDRPQCPARLDRFIEASVLDWIEHPDVTQRELSDLFVAVFQEYVEPVPS